MTTLILEASGTRPQRRIKVDESVFIGTCVASLVETLGYPRGDEQGRPLVYQLRQVGATRPLPNTFRMDQAQVRSGAHVVLEVEKANDATFPMEGLRAEVVQPPRSWSRRSTLFLLGTILAGALAGLSTALAHRLLLAQQRHVPTTTVVPTRAPLFLAGAQKLLTFSGHTQGVRAVSWSPDGTMLATGGDDAQVLLWKRTGTIQQRLQHPLPVLALAWGPDGQSVVTGSGSQIAFFSAQTGALLSRTSHWHSANVASLAWTANNQQQVVSGGADTRAVVWETLTYQPQKTFTLHTAPIESVTWGLDGVTVASSSSGGVVRVWNAETTQETHGLYRDAPVPMRSCAFSPTTPSLAVGGDDGVVRVWDGFLCQQQSASPIGMICQDPPLRLRAAKKAIRALAWSPDGRYLASGGKDGIVVVWYPALRQTPLLTIPIGMAIQSLAWSPQGDQLATAAGSSVIIWTLHT